MISSVLIANRGEIARRIIRTARELGVRTIAVYSEADAQAPFVMEADVAILIGPAPARESYLVPEKILAAARQTGAEAIHPGYGFLSENADFAQAVIDAGLVWIGPPPSAIRAMGLKDAAKKVMIAAGVPTTPGYLGEDQSVERLAAEAAQIGFPVLIKAVAGGGGKGMRKVDRAEDFAALLASCQREASASFGDDRVLLEKYVTRPRHIEVQVFGDSHGNVVHLFERDCSLQRRHQKVIEEAPAPGMDEATRAAVCGAAVKAAQAVGYVGAGTVEFIADASEGLRADRIWFMEMNTRLQVEHPVTEMITGQDLVEWQLLVASGEPLPLAQDEIEIDGWAMEARLYAENPATGFLPSTGPLTHFRLPEGDVRVDSAVEEGGEVTPFYDPMIAKLIAHGVDREDAAARLAEACRLVEVWPVKTNAAFLARCASDPDFVGGAVDTGFIEARLEDLTRREFSDAPTLAAIGQRLEAFMEADQPRADVWASAPSRLLGFRMNAPRAAMKLPLAVDGKAMPLRVALAGGTGDDWSWDITVEDGRPLDDVDVLPSAFGGDPLYVFEGGDVREFDFTYQAGGAHAAASDGAILSPMPGKIVSVAVEAGQAVVKGQTLLTLEAMKMEHALAAPFDGVVAELSAVAGGQVSEGVVLAKLEPVA
ncbi:propionyl-CoA carboxylase alpha chain/3-methylcrotonyl-CoA carboxylase alpha subunit [Caulobacter rhizosphaerae]|uniref:Propionyl-CoA carboxylase alpha chain/3-methylcrotonyl-CoA carboxylase alpha subunit n=1 Tax=Caulobacter rhizosphaerae TaxID=2010972 RepID=A0ABU1MUZ6_9CAUL|nr:acetyl/propionyl/methylcrotonyl-CoA carboxylase subunit alpha [Caulobacter rhizosphaerae]MDR6529706.1 propionyl-CoA carboxylase alpha chain/3-methylcrotonyl-CoA carboxylase alpha subunit [Caulobacter rhizosphaerae]